MIKLSRILTIKVIILLISISVISSANDIKIEEELIENPEFEKLDDQIEIISYIGGIAFEVNKTGFIFNKPIRITPWKSAIFIIGIKFPSLYSYKMFFYYHPNCIIKVSRFFGYVKKVNEFSFDVSGIAIRNIVNIEW